MSSQSIEWLDEEAILDTMLLLQEQYAGVPLGIIKPQPHRLYRQLGRSFTLLWQRPLGPGRSQ